MFNLSTLFYLIPLYFLVIAPLLRQFFPSDTTTTFSSFPSSSSSDYGYEYEYDDDDNDVAQHNDQNNNLILNPDILSLPDNITVSCPEDDYRIHLLSRTPLVIYIEGFLSLEEADHLLEISKSNYTPSIIFNGQTTTVDPSKRLSDRSLLPRDTTVRCIENRAAAFQGWKPHLYIERMWAQRYNVSGHYRHHYDWAGSAKARGGDRLSTFMVYLGDECEGGGTNFPRLRRPRGQGWCRFIDCEESSPQASGGAGGSEEREMEKQEKKKQKVEGGITFKPIKGNAVFWENLRPDGEGYPETWHAAFPVTKGEKVGLNIWSWYQPPRGRWSL